MTQHPLAQPSTSRADPMAGAILERESEHHSETESSEWRASEDDDEWVDSNAEETSLRKPHRKVNGRTSGTMVDSVRLSPRKRVGRKGPAVNLTRKNTTPTPSSSLSRQVPIQKPPKIDIWPVVLNGLWEGTKFTAEYTKHLVKNALHYLRFPLSIFLMFYVLSLMAGYISQSLYKAFSPVCIVPGFSSLPVCRTSTVLLPDSSGNSNKTPKWADYSTLMDVQSKSFEQLLEDSAGGSGLSLEIKQAEMATSDLLARVHVSDLKARDSLASTLSEFIDDAKKTSRGLQKLTSKVGGAVDNIMAVNDYALQSIESARAEEASHWSMKRVMIWKNSVKQTNEVVMRTFEEAMNVLSANMERLILEAEYSLQNLNNLEERLATLHEIVVREDSSILSAKADLLEDLWTRLGGNRKSLRNADYHLGILKGLGTYRQQALAHVVAALQTLRAMSEDMEDMRERVAAPDLIGDSVPVEVHMKSIQMGLERLREGRIRAKKLEEDAIRRVLSVDDGSNKD